MKNGKGCGEILSHNPGKVGRLRKEVKKGQEESSYNPGKVGRAGGGRQGVEERLPSPEEYLRRNPIPGGMLYYPGSFVDAEPMKLFHGHGGLRRFIHVDYRPGIGEEYYQKTTENIFNGSMTTRPIGPEKFKARRWKDVWHPQAGERWIQEAVRSFGFHQEFRFAAPQKHVDFMFMAVDAVGAWKFLIRTGYLPNVVVLCADGLNWVPGGFGGDGKFYEEVKKAGHWPEYLYVGCARPWPGYTQVSRTVKMYDLPARAIYRREGPGKPSYNPGKVGWLGGGGG